MKKVFFDTWGWVAIAHKNDSSHKKVVSFYQEFLLNKGIPVTSDYVLSETVTLLRAKTHPEGVSTFIDTLLEAAGNGRIQLETIDEKRWKKTWDLCKKYWDKPDISFVDLSSFSIMKEKRIVEVLTADKHFEEVGLGFRKLF